VKKEFSLICELAAHMLGKVGPCGAKLGARPCNGNEVRKVEETLEILPGRELMQRIGPENEKRLPFRLLREQCEGVHRVRGAFRNDLEIRNLELWIPGTGQPSLPLSRSEERRVGKECRSRWSPYH